MATYIEDEEERVEVARLRAIEERQEELRGRISGPHALARYQERLGEVEEGEEKGGYEDSKGKRDSTSGALRLPAKKVRAAQATSPRSEHGETDPPNESIHSPPEPVAPPQPIVHRSPGGK